MQIQLNPEDLTTHDLMRFLHPLVGKRVWFRMVEMEDKVDRFGRRFEANRRLVATVLRVYALPDFRVRLDTSEGVLEVGEFISAEPYERFDNGGKDRYAP